MTVPAWKHRGWSVGLLGLSVAVPPAVNLADGLTWIWTPSLPPPLFQLLVEAGVLDVWLLLDLLAASGVLGGFAVKAAAAGETTAAAWALAAVSVTSLAAAVTGPHQLLPAGYGVAYTTALMLVRSCSQAQRASTGGPPCDHVT
ncbi:hypothetical protein [Nonomuraea zeae]|uniref:Uncharacterized protein n=1 Tax=Nonomuraea zeae TaxID=1642303 RepID=A0A5S4GFU9_9ACTN|nr:hypothetical protein [Nonomuraea zeae]TMR31847.1 hypothetical protein ETD85_24430 [Nonomuraea zeae]